MARIEILAPVGSEEMLRAAVFSGADAVYLGFSGFNARTGAGNFDADSLQEAVRFCHARGVAVHVAPFREQHLHHTETVHCCGKNHRAARRSELHCPAFSARRKGYVHRKQSHHRFRRLPLRSRSFLSRKVRYGFLF